MSDLVPAGSASTPAPADDDNRYQALQAKLARFGKALDDTAVKLESLRRRAKTNAEHTEGVATDIANAGLDRKFVEMTETVALGLRAAAGEVRTLHGTAIEAADRAYDAKRTHAKLYGPLDEVRSTRRERTPRPGFFTR